MTTGRAAAERYLRSPFVEAGWKPRAAGWFTKAIESGFLGVIAVGAASDNKPAGTADVVLHVGLRSEEVEAVVESVCAPGLPKYQHRTWTAPLGYLLPEHAWAAGEREFSQSKAEEPANDLVRLVVQHAEPRLSEVALDSDELLRLVERSVGSMGTPGLCRVAALKAQTRGIKEAAQYVRDRVASLSDRADLAAQAERELAPLLLAQLRESESPRVSWRLG